MDLHSREDRCKTCRFWIPATDELLGIGQCRRFPPVVIEGLNRAELSVEDNPFQGVWPETCSYDWCGEWKPKE